DATLEDVTLADAPAQPIASTTLRVLTDSPLHFTIRYDPARIDPTHRYAVRARIADGDRMLFTTQSSYPVLEDRSYHVDVDLHEVASTNEPVGSIDVAPNVTIENTYWKLIRAGTLTVQVPADTQEPHFILQPDEGRVSGFGGCNLFTGSYT